ncbi:MAG TPA: hypothetical protein VII72_20185 [Myxococcota bacterium]|jgi:hypothetical protein
MREPCFLRPSALAAIASIAVSACASAPEPRAEDWLSGDVVGYRLLEKRDFRAEDSSRLWGNVYHGAEICVHIVPTADHEQTGAFRAVMKPECSFWNEAVGPIGTLGGVAGASVLPGLPTAQPEWYTLQHEQIHFAIMEVAARRLSARIAEIPASERSAPGIESAYRLTLTHTEKRHAEFDGDTSGTFDPRKLDLWVRVLETEMRRLCGKQAHCWVRHRNPLGWGG